MENAPARESEGAVIRQGDSPSPITPARRRKVVFQLPDGSCFALSGKTARVMAMLIARLASGLTAQGAWPSTTRLAAIIHQLRTRYGLEISTGTERREDSRFGRYRLVTPVTLKR